LERRAIILSLVVLVVLAPANVLGGSYSYLTPNDSSDTENNQLDKRVQGWTGSEEKGRIVQNPTAALFKSMAVPGWGQVGNKKYIKAGFVIGLESWFFFQNAAELDPNRTFLFNRFQATKNDRNLFAWLTGTAIFVSMFDAFVDAHLSGFPKKTDNGGVSIAPFPELIDEEIVWRAELSYSF